MQKKKIGAYEATGLYENMKILIIKLCRKVVCYLFIYDKCSCMLSVFHMLFRWSASSKKQIWVPIYYTFHLVG